MFLPIPFIGLFRLNKTGRIGFPASGIVAWGDRILGALIWICLIGGFAAAYVLIRKEQPGGINYMFYGALVAIAMRATHWFWLRRVRIVRIGTGSLEVRFALESYAREFCRLNELNCRDHPAKKRMTPVTVNDVH